MIYCVITYHFTSLGICKTCKTFKITFLKNETNQKLNSIPDFTLNYFHHNEAEV